MIKRLEHVGLSVVNLERSIRFYRDLLGMDVVVTEEQFEGPLFRQILGLPTATGRVALVKRGEVEFELFEFSQPVPKRADLHRPVSDNGITHFCLVVSDIDGLYQRLRRAGVHFHCPPLDFGSAKATYGRDPDGNVFELVENIA